MRTLRVIGLWEFTKDEIRFAASEIPTPGERIHLVVAPGVLSFVVEVETVGEQGYALGFVRQRCRGADLRAATRTSGSVRFGTPGTRDDT